MEVYVLKFYISLSHPEVQFYFTGRARTKLRI